MKTKTPRLINLLILTLITAFTWIGFSVQRAVTQKPDPVVPDSVSKTLDPNLDITTIEKIKSRLFLSEGEIPQTQISVSPTPSPTSTPTTTPSATPATEQTQTPTATPTATSEGGTQP